MFNSQAINKLATLFGVEGVASSCFKWLPPNLNLSLDLFHSSLGERISFVI